ncbi:hypothetical protein LguiB_017635 [Lonicera macranthoides]
MEDGDGGVKELEIIMVEVVEEEAVYGNGGEWMQQWCGGWDFTFVDHIEDPYKETKEDYHFMVEEEEDKENKEEEFDFPGTETNRENKQIDLEEFNEFVNTTENVFEQEENKGLMSQG